MNHASCLCGAVQFTINGDLKAPRYCHCRNCAKFAGTSPATWAMAEMAAIRLSTPEGDISQFDSGKGLRCFCAQCGAPVWFRSLDFPDIVAIPLGVIDDGDVPAPEMHIWVQSKPDWCAISDALPQHATNP